MPTQYRIEGGESVIGISDRLGFFAETIWQHPENDALRDKREDMNILLPGDVLHIPDKVPKEVDRPTGQRHVFRRRGIPALFRLQLFLAEAPRARQKYRLTVDGKTVHGTTNSEGVLTRYVPAQAREGELEIGPDQFRVRLHFGGLDPLREWIGVKKRLINMGYHCGALDNAPNDETRTAVILLQNRCGIEATGVIDLNDPGDPTLGKLRTLHDSDVMYPQPPESTAA